MGFCSLRLLLRFAAFEPLLLLLAAAFEEVADNGSEGVHIDEERVVAADAVQFSELRIAANR